MNAFGKTLGIVALLGIILGGALLYLGSDAQASGGPADSFIGYGFVFIILGIICGVLWLVVGAVKRPSAPSSQTQQLVTREDGTVGYSDVPPPSNR